MFSMPGYVTETLAFLATLFIFVIGLGALAVVVLFIRDSLNREDAIRRNYPVIGRFRHIFSTLGEFFRQYFFAMDREEMPFNRAEREWVHRAGKRKGNTSAFGSTKNLNAPGARVFVNCPFPTLDEDAVDTEKKTIGPYCREPYTTTSFFNISAMSYGAISKPAVRALSHGAKMAGIWLNTGEGGLAPYHLEGGCDLVFQIGTAKYGVRTPDGKLSDDKLREVADHEQVRMFEVKLSQGAKPGKGGILPAKKVNEEIAAIRGIPAWQDSISPNRFPEVDNVAELLDFVGHIRDVTGKPVGIKTVIGAWGWLDDMCAEVTKRGLESAPDFITIDSGDGGTGAGPMPLMDNVGLLVKESLPMVVDKLTAHGLRERVRVIASGKLITPAEVAWALCAGADFAQSARGFMFALGCIQAMRCNKDTCPTGVTTHNPRLQKGLDPQVKSHRVAGYAQSVMEEVAILAHSCGVHEPRQLKRFHVRIVGPDGMSTPMNELYPKPHEAQPKAEAHGQTKVPGQA